MESYNFLYVNTLVQDYLKYVCQEAELAAAPNRVAEVLRKAGSSAQKEVEGNLRPYADSLEIRSVEEAGNIFNQVMENEFADGKINWGRILTIFLFGGILAKKLQGPLAKENLKQISYFITDYIVSTKGKWISENGGWVSFLSPFCCSVSKLCPTLRDPMDRSMPAHPVLRCLSESAQTQTDII